KRHEDFETLLLHYASHHPKDRPARIGCEVHLLQERLTTNLFSTQASCIVRRGKQTIRRRIPARVIYAVPNRTEPMRIFPQHSIQTASTCRCQDFAPVVLAHSGGSVSVKNSAFKKIQPSEKLDAVERKEPLRQIREMKIESPETALVSNVVDRQNRVERQPVCMHKNGHQRRRPIVHVQNLQLRCQSPGQFDDCFAEKNESRSIIFVRLAALAVNSSAIKKFIAADEEQLHVAGAAAFQVPRNVSRIADSHLNSYTGVLLLKRAILSNLTIERQRHADLMPTSTQRARQRVHDIYQRARPLHRGSLGAAH